VSRTPFVDERCSFVERRSLTNAVRSSNAVRYRTLFVSPIDAHPPERDSRPFRYRTLFVIERCS